MLLWGLNESEVRAVVARVSADKYAGNVTFGRSNTPIRQEGPRVRFTLGVLDSHGEGARMTPGTPWSNPRHTVAATWQAHYDVMLALFDAGATRISSGMADYRAGMARVRDDGYDGRRDQWHTFGPFDSGLDAFLALAERTADINAGSIMAPAAFGDL